MRERLSEIWFSQFNEDSSSERKILALCFFADVVYLIYFSSSNVFQLVSPEFKNF